MRIVKFKGGLGNQMFQYAFAKLIEKRTGDEVRLDYSAYFSLSKDTVRVPRITKFNLSLAAASQEEVKYACRFPRIGSSLSFPYKACVYLDKMLNSKYFFESSRAYISPELIQDKMYFDGYWQGWRYIEEVKEELEREFTPCNDLSKKTLATMEQMQVENSVFVGVRKGDYTQNKKAIAHYGNFTSEYYREAMDYIAAKVDDPVFYVFSNDVDWCKMNIDWGKHKVIYREPEQQTDDFEELMLMASCKHAVMVNSTYHWWGAYLIKNPEKIIVCPDKWFFDGSPIEIVPPTWTKIKAR